MQLLLTITIPGNFDAEDDLGVVLYDEALFQDFVVAIGWEVAKIIEVATERRVLRRDVEVTLEEYSGGEESQ